MHRLVETELFFQRLDELWIKPLRTLVFDATIVARLGLIVAPRFIPGIAADAGSRIRIRALHLGDHLLDGTAGYKLDHGKCHEHDPNQCRDHQQNAFEEIGAHVVNQFPFVESYHQVSTIPRSYLGFTEGQPKRSQWAIQ